MTLRFVEDQQCPFITLNCTEFDQTRFDKGKIYHWRTHIFFEALIWGLPCLQGDQTLTLFDII